MPDALVYATRTPLPDPGVAPLSAAGLRVRQHADDAPPSREELESELLVADAAIVTPVDVIDDTLLRGAKMLKVLATIAVGYDNIDVQAAQECGIVVTNTPDVLSDATADLAFALLLATTRRVVEGDKDVRAGRFTGWSPTGYLGHDVFGATIGIIGMGRIGKAVAKRARGFDMNILFTSRTLKPVTAEQFDAEQVTIVEALQRSDYIVITAPLTPETHHLINADAFELMKPNAYVVNVGRGPVVDEVALVEALRAHRIAGAALDVFEREPVIESGLMELDNVVLTPHIGSATAETRAEMMRLCCDNIISVIDGDPPITPVLPA